MPTSLKISDELAPANLILNFCSQAERCRVPNLRRWAERRKPGNVLTSVVNLGILGSQRAPGLVLSLIIPPTLHSEEYSTQLAWRDAATRPFLHDTQKEKQYQRKMSQKLDESRANKEGLEIRTAQEHSILKNQIVRHQASTKHPPPSPNHTISKGHDGSQLK